MTPEEEFTRRLEVFRGEVESAMQFFYAYLTIHAVASEDKQVYEVLNDYATFWRTNLGALQTSTFIALGRIFDLDSKHNVRDLIKFAMDNPSIFSRDALRGRKIKQSDGPKPWLDRYISEAYVPKASDFKRLRGYVSKYSKLYTKNYRDLRNKVFAHREMSNSEEEAVLFAKTNIRELERILAFLGALQSALLQLLDNGRRPVLRPRRHSLNSLRKGKGSKNRAQQIQERITQETEAFLQTLGT
jgi:hypothetical protein